MEKIIARPGLEPVLEKIFKHVASSTLKKCLLVCKYWNQVVQNPYFLLIRLRLTKMPEDILKKWKELAHSLQEDVNLTQSLSKCFFWALAACKNIGFVSPETPASALGLVPLLEFITKHAKIEFIGEVNNKATLLHFAAGCGQLEALKFLSKLTENLAMRNEDGITPIHAGAKSGKVEIMKYFQEMGCAMNIPASSGWTPFHIAVKNGQIEMVKFLINLIEDPFIPDIDGKTVLHLAADYGQHETLEHLMSLRENPNQAMTSNDPKLDGATPLHFAARRGHIKCVKLLLPFASGSDVKKSNGQTPIHWASCKGRLKILEYFATQMKNINAPIANNGWRPMHCAASKGHLEIVKFLCMIDQTQANIPISCNKPYKGGYTPLHLAAMNGHHKIVEHLSDFVDNLSEPTFNAQKLTALNLALLKKHSETVKVILAKLYE